MGHSGGSRRLWLAVGLSPLLHLAGGVAVVAVSAAADGPGTHDADSARMADRPAPPEENERKVPLGIEKSKSATITWIGFETPTEHAAAEAETDQPSLTRDAPSPPPQPTQVHTEAAEEPVQDPSEAAPAEAEVAEARPEAVPPPVQTEAAAETVASEPVADPMALVERAGERLVPALEALMARLVVAPATKPQESDRAPTAEELAPPVREPAERSEERAKPAEAGVPPPPSPLREPSPDQSEKETDAFSREKPVVVRPGKPAAAEGLEIETRHLRLSLYAQVMNGPTRAKVLATFNRQGRVTRVEFVKRTGIKDVDEPILDCVYSWRAKGRAIQELPANDPKAGVVVPFEIVIH